jgi:hypothetical protein
MRVVNYEGIGEWVQRMKVKARLIPTTVGLNYTRSWKATETPKLAWSRKHTYVMGVTTDNVSPTAEWKVQVKAVLDRPAPVADVVKEFTLPFDPSCGANPGGLRTGRNAR